jgi:hypothetical protein
MQEFAEDYDGGPGGRRRGAASHAQRKAGAHPAAAPCSGAGGRAPDGRRCGRFDPHMGTR